MTERVKKSPLLQGTGIPKFSEITHSEINKSIPILLEDLDKKLCILENNLEKIFKTKEDITWNCLIKPLYQIEEKLRWSWGVVSHLNGVANSPELREAYSSQQPNIVRFSNRLGQSQVIFQALRQLSSKKDILNETQERIVSAELLAMKNSGVGLVGAKKDLFNSNTQRLAELSTKFSNNILDATKNWKLLLTKKEEVVGLPSRSLEAMSKAANESSEYNAITNKEATLENGPWLLTLDMPTYSSFITYAENRPLREKIYKAYISRASSGEKNNEDLIKEILIIRSKQAQLLGYQNWGELSIANKMAKDVDEVENLLEELRSAAMPAAKKELERLQSFINKLNPTESYEIAPWDINFVSEKLKEELFNLDQEKLRPWFPLPGVLDGLFKLCERLFAISIESDNSNYYAWHDDVKFFKLRDEKGVHIASFFLDPYSRPESKRGGAWMDECLTKDISINGEQVLPIAYLVCNQTPPVGDTPSLMSFEEVKTLFHEFGHGLQHMLTKVDEPKAAGINNVEWDAVELPSQFMENWCLDERTLKDIGKHWQTNKLLPDSESKKLRLNQTFNSGLATLRQIHFALTDIRLHTTWNEHQGLTPDQLRRNIAKSTCAIEPIAEDKFLCGFSHIFAGGYSAGYYSYKWAEVLSADAFSLFEETGLNNENEIKAIGNLFRDTVLSLGGSRAPSEIFKLFRGRGATTDALIRHSGLTPAVGK